MTFANRLLFVLISEPNAVHLLARFIAMLTSACFLNIFACPFDIYIGVLLHMIWFIMFEERKCLMQLLSNELSFIRKYISLNVLQCLELFIRKKKSHTHTSKQRHEQTNIWHKSLIQLVTFCIVVFLYNVCKQIIICID